jgi:hypothetical protein
MSKNFQPVIDELRTLIETTRAGRLTQADEQKGAALFKELVATGGKALSGALDLIGDLPWFIPVNGTMEGWPELSPAKQRNFLSALKPLESEAARRMRLSIARGLYRVDPASALKLLIASLLAIRTENGFEARDRQVFANVLIGKNKPWLVQIDLKSLKPAEAKLLALAAIESSAGANPPAAMAVIQWAREQQTLTDLPESIQQDLAKNFRKWSTRWQKELASEELPPLIDEAIKAKLAKALPENPPEQKAEQAHPVSNRDDEIVSQSAPPRLPGRNEQKQQRHGPKGQPTREIHTKQNASQRNRPERSDNRLQQEARRAPEISDLLRQIDLQFQELRSELRATRNQAKQSAPPPRTTETASVGHTREIAKLREENAQLADAIRQLQDTLSQLATDDFDEAVSRKADSNAPVTDPLEQYKSLLTLRLREQIVNFQELNPHRHVDGLPLLLDNILRTLHENGIDLTDIQAPPVTAKRRY